MKEFRPPRGPVLDAYLEYEKRKRKHKPKTAVTMICHGTAIAYAYDLGPGRALFVATNHRGNQRATVMGGGRDGEPSEDRWRTVEACLPEQPPADVFEETRRVPTGCPVGNHGVLVTRSQLKDAVAMYREGRRPAKMALRFDPATRCAVVDSITFHM